MKHTQNASNIVKKLGSLAEESPGKCSEALEKTSGKRDGDGSASTREPGNAAECMLTE